MNNKDKVSRDGLPRQKFQHSKANDKLSLISQTKPNKPKGNMKLKATRKIIALLNHFKSLIKQKQNSKAEGIKQARHSGQKHSKTKQSINKT